MQYNYKFRNFNQESIMPQIIYDEQTQKKITALQKKIRVLEDQQDELKLQIEKLKAGCSAIKIGDAITWTSGNKQRHGIVKGISVSWNSYEYRCIIKSSTGRTIGNATVTESHHPMLEDKQNDSVDQKRSK